MSYNVYLSKNIFYIIKTLQNHDARSAKRVRLSAYLFQNCNQLSSLYILLAVPSVFSLYSSSSPFYFLFLQSYVSLHYLSFLLSSLSSLLPVLTYVIVLSFQSSASLSKYNLASLMPAAIMYYLSSLLPAAILYYLSIVFCQPIITVYYLSSLMPAYHNIILLVFCQPIYYIISFVFCQSIIILFIQSSASPSLYYLSSLLPASHYIIFPSFCQHCLGEET